MSSRRGRFRNKRDLTGFENLSGLVNLNPNRPWLARAADGLLRRMQFLLYSPSLTQPEHELNWG